MNDIERIKNRVDEYCKSFRNKVIMRYDNIDETDDAIKLYTRNVSDAIVDFCMYAMIDLNIDKRLVIFVEVINMIPNYEGTTVVFNGLHYDFRYADYRDSLITQLHFFRALGYANLLNRPELFRKILEIGGKNHFEKVKMLLNTCSKTVECRAELIDYINKHNTPKEELML